MTNYEYHRYNNEVKPIIETGVNRLTPDYDQDMLLH